jgi:hypothetical protein
MRLAACFLVAVALLLSGGAALTARAEDDPNKIPDGDPIEGTTSVPRPVLRRSALVFNNYNLFLDPNPYVVTKEFSFVYTSEPDPSLGPGKRRALFHLIYQRSNGPQASERIFGHAWSRDLRNWWIDTLAFAVDTTWWNTAHVWSAGTCSTPESTIKVTSGSATRARRRSIRRTRSGMAGAR